MRTGAGTSKRDDVRELNAKLSIKSKYAERGAVARHKRGLNVVEQDVSWNKDLSDEDWATIGGTTRLEVLNMESCYIQAGTIVRYMRGLDIEELSISWNTNLSNEDWRTIGGMTMLSRLYMGGCDIGKEQVLRYLERLQCHIASQNVFTAADCII